MVPTQMAPKPKAEHLEMCRELWNLEGEIKLHRHVENFVYTTKQNGQEVILRLTAPIHRLAEDLESELDWIDYLSKAHMPVVKPLLSDRQRLVETINIQPDEYFASLFTKAQGRAPDQAEIFSDQLFYNWGVCIGRLHTLTKDYTPTGNLKIRNPWDQEHGFRLALSGLDKNEKVPYNKFHEMVDWLKSLEKSKDTFGLVHADLHRGNFFVHNNQLTVFDFDDCCYHWFLFDLAVPLFGLERYFQENSMAVNYAKGVEHYLAGYLGENPTSDEWIKRLDAFLSYRAVFLYHWIKGRILEGTLDSEIEKRCRETFPWYLEQISKKVALV